MFDRQAIELSPRSYFRAFAVLTAIGFLVPIRVGDLPGYDDARYALVAKQIVISGDWLNTQYNGTPDFEHPPLLEWIQAAFFSVFGVSDAVAKVPSALLGLGTVLLAAWLARRLTGDPWLGVLAMFTLASSAYFVKYTARAMTDVPVTFFFLAAMCAWLLTEDDPRWYLAAGAFTAMALMTRGLIGFALPAIFGLDLMIARRRPHWGYAFAALAVAILPLVFWYWRLIDHYGQVFYTAHEAWLDREAFGALSPSWRRYTGVPEYLFMLAKSYWPWLPFAIAGMVAVIRGRQRRLYLLLIWFGVVLLMCGAARSRVLRYILPAYPALSILAAIGLVSLIPVRFIRKGLLFAAPVLAVGVLAIAIFPPVTRHQPEVGAIAKAATAVTPTGDRIAFYDRGAPLYDEVNLLLWYGGRNIAFLLSPAELEQALEARKTPVFIVDGDTFQTRFRSRIAYDFVAKIGTLVCVRLRPEIN
ncbi:MAG: glycosyltransferase family 39 protein [Acidobacteriota bacterium]